MIITPKKELQLKIEKGICNTNFYPVYQIVFSQDESPTLYFGIYDYLLPNYGTLDEFDIVSEKLPSTWGLYSSSYRKYYYLSPRKWGDHSLWEYSFWEDFDNEKEEAIACYKEEIGIMEREAMQEMIELGLIEEELEQ